MMKKIYSTIFYLIFSLNAFCQWQNIALNGNSIKALASDNSRIFAATNGNVFLSLDNGLTFSNVSDGIDQSVVIREIKISNQSVYLSTNSGIFYSENNGTSWSQLNNGLTSLSVYSIEEFQNKLYAGTQNGVFVSTDNGNNWSFLAFPSGGVNFTGKLKSINNNLYAYVYSSGLKISSDGLTWEDIGNGLGISGTISDLEGQGNDLFMVQISFSGAFEVSSDAGYNWTNPISFSSARCLALNQNNLFVGGDNRIYYSPNLSNNLQQINDGLPATFAAVKLVIQGDFVFAALGSTGIWKRSISGISVSNQNEFINRSAFTVYPNPASQSITLNTNIKIEKGSFVNIFTVQGQLLERIELSSQNNRIPLDNLPSGIYFLDVNSDKEKQTLKFFKE
jgi:photosystem II stability/assembly factor-like uncharacterized protein